MTVKTLRYARVASGLFVGFEVGEVLNDTIKSYKDGGHWGKELFEGFSEIGGGYAGTAITVFLLSEPLGWVVIVPAAIGSMLSGDFVENIAKHIDKHF